MAAVKHRLQALEVEVATLRHSQAQLVQNTGSLQSIWDVSDLEVPDGTHARELPREQFPIPTTNGSAPVAATRAAQLSPFNDDCASTSRFTIRGHPLLATSGPEVLRLLDIYDEECGVLYPIVDIDSMRQLAIVFYDQTAAQRGASSWREVTLDQHLQSPLQILMVVLAIAGAIANPDAPAFSCALVDAIEAEIDHRPCGAKAETHLVGILFLMVS